MNITQNAKDCQRQQPCAVSSCSFSPRLTSQLIFCQDKAGKPGNSNSLSLWRMGRCKYNNAVMCITQHWRNNSFHHHFKPPIVDFFTFWVQEHEWEHSKQEHKSIQVLSIQHSYSPINTLKETWVPVPCPSILYQADGSSRWPSFTFWASAIPSNKLNQY